MTTKKETEKEVSGKEAVEKIATNKEVTTKNIKDMTDHEKRQLLDKLMHKKGDNPANLSKSDMEIYEALQKWKDEL